nr:HAMP domain-containing sensor histidine kinase [uncultured Eubacterium sp.]
MFKKLRKQIILIELAAFLFVTIIILASINIVSHNQMHKNAHQVLVMLSENNGQLKQSDNIYNKYKNYDIGFNAKLNEETPYNTRYFYVELDKEGNIDNYNLNHIAAISDKDVAKFVKRIYRLPRDEGSVSTYRYLKKETDSGMTIYFVDCYMQNKYVSYIFKISLLVGFICMIIILLVVYFLSGKVIKPMEKNMEQQKQFITDASHELKTPLAAISANVDVLELINDNPDSIDTTKKIKRQVSQMSTLINEMLALARMNSMESKNEAPVSINVSSLLEQQIDDIMPIVKSKDITLHHEIANDLSCMGKLKEISRLFSVLLDNATKYCTSGGNINISLAKEGKNIHFKISNSSEPIDKHDLEHIFDRFYRANKARTRAEGSYGIGLSIAKAIVENHNGKIVAKNVADGIQFSVVIPQK